MKRTDRTCSREDCDSKHYAKGLCRSHYNIAARDRLRGGPVPPRPPKPPRPTHRKPGPAQAYFLAHITDETDECFAWPFTKGGIRQYGQVYMNGRNRQVHALACEYAHGPRPPGMQAIHGPCGATSGECWNPRHVDWGTRRKNALDRHRGGVAWVIRGERARDAKLTDEQVAAVLDLWVSGGVTQTQVAAEFGVKANTINTIITGKAWSHIHRPPGLPQVYQQVREKRTLTDETVAALLHRFASGGVTSVELGREFGVKANTVNVILNGQAWKHIPRPPRADGQPWRTGELVHPKVKLTEANAREILARYAAGERTPRAFAKEFGVHRESIRTLVAGKSWKHLPRA